MVTLNEMVSKFLRLYELAPLTFDAVRQIPYLARCETYEAFLESGEIGPVQVIYGLSTKITKIF